MNKPFIIADKNTKSLKIKKKIIKILIKEKIKRSNVVIVIGGDGFMLQTLKKNKNLKKSSWLKILYKKYINPLKDVKHEKKPLNIILSLI